MMVTMTTYLIIGTVLFSVTVKSCISTDIVIEGEQMVITCVNEECISNMSSIFKRYETIITELHIQHCQLTNVPADICHLSYVTDVYLNNNNMMSLPENDSLPCANQIETLDLSCNHLRYIHSEYFKVFTNLRKLVLSRNNLTHIDPYLFLIPSLCKLDLDHNQLTEVGIWMTRLPMFIKEIPIRVNMSHNLINTFINGVDFKLETANFTDNMDIEIDLRHNQFTHWNSLRQILGITDVADKLKKIHYIPWKMRYLIKLGENPYVCDCKLHVVMKLLKILYWTPIGIAVSDSICHSPERLKGISLKEVQLTDYQCVVHDCLTPGCQCIKTPENSTLRISCQNKSLTSYPVILSNSSYRNYEVYLGNNSFTEISYQPYWINTSILDLPNNVIRKLNNVSLRHFRNLRYLSLQNNLLGILLETQFGSWNNNLTGNPIGCDCHGAWLKLITSEKTHPITDLDRITCFSPSWNKGKPFNAVPISEFICDKMNPIPLSVSLSIIALLIIICCFIVYIKRYTIRFYLYAKMGWKFSKAYSSESDSKEYDIFISYSNLDEHRACSIIKALEEYSPPFRVAIHYRDFIPGKSIAENVIHCIESSKCTLMMISRNFISSEWCQYEFKAAHHGAIIERKSKVLLVLLERLDTDQLDADLKLYIKTHTYLEVKDPQFTAKLILALPKPCGRRNSIGL